MRLIVAAERLMPRRAVAVSPSVPSRRVRGLILVLTIMEMVFAVSQLALSMGYSAGALQAFLVDLQGLVVAAGAIGAAATLLAVLVIWRREMQTHG